MMGQALRRTVARSMAALLFGVAAAGALRFAVGIAAGESGVVRSAVRDGAIRVEAWDASTADIIGDLARTLGFEVRGDIPAGDVHITRDLEGTLDELLEKLLVNANYMLITDAGAPKRLIVLPAGNAVAVSSQGDALEMSVEQLRQKESELVAQIAQYVDQRDEARERANTQFVRKLDRYVAQLSAEAEAIRARLPR
jgi:hypothetical protein